MKKNIIIPLIFIFTSVQIFGQIGINTQNPQSGSVLHFDPKGDTSGTNNTTDDVIIDSDGKLRIGTTQADSDPTVKVHVEGKYSMPNGFQGVGRALVSDKNGLAYWQTLSLGNQDAEWMVTSSPTINDETPVKIEGVASFFSNKLGATTNNTSSVTIPPGRYVIFLRGNIEIIKDYGIMRLFNGNTEIYNVTYGEYLSGAAIYQEFTSDATLSLSYEAINVGASTTTGEILFLSPLPYTIPGGGPLTLWARLEILKIQS